MPWENLRKKLRYGNWRKLNLKVKHLSRWCWLMAALLLSSLERYDSIYPDTKYLSSKGGCSQLFIMICSCLKTNSHSLLCQNYFKWQVAVLLLNQHHHCNSLPFTSLILWTKGVAGPPPFGQGWPKPPFFLFFVFSVLVLFSRFLFIFYFYEELLLSLGGHWPFLVVWVDIDNGVVVWGVCVLFPIF